MTEAQAKEALAARWDAAWPAASSPASVPFTLANEAFTPPASAALFAALWHGGLAERQLTMGPIGARRFEYRGALNVRLFGPVDDGEARLATLAVAVRTVLASQTIGGALWTAGAASAPARLGAWWTVTLTVPYRFYDRR